MYLNNNLNIQDIYEYIFSMLKNIYLKYPYIDLSDNDIKDYLMDKINKNINKIKDVNHFAEFVKKKFLIYIEEEIKSELKNEETFIKPVLRFINHNIRNVKNVDSVLEFFSKLENFLEMHDFVIGKEEIFKIIHNSLDINKALDIIYNTRDEFESDNVSSDLMLNFLEVYCQIKGIEIYTSSKSEEKDEVLFNDPTEIVSEEFYFDDLIREIIIRSSKNPLLTDEEQKILIKRAQSGDETAKDLLVERNSRLIISIAKRYSGKGVDFLDLYQEGVIGLIDAIYKFNLEKDNTLSTYAVWWIKRSILRCINMNARTIRIPIRDIERIHKINMIQNEYYLKYNREATVEELSELLQISPKKIVDLISDKEVISLNNKLDSSETEFEDLTDNGEVLLEDRIAEQDTNNRLKQLIDTALTVREKHVIIHRFGFYGNSAKTLEEIGRLLGVTRENIRKIESKALYKLKIAMANDNKSNTVDIANEKDIDYTSLYDYFNKYSKHLIDKIVFSLDKEEIILLKLRFGSDFCTINPYVTWTNEEYNNLQQVLKKLKRLFESEMNKTSRVFYGHRNLYYYLENYSKLEIDDALDQLGVKDLLLLEDIFGPNFEQTIANPDENKIRDRKFYQLKHKITIILKGNTRTLYKIFGNFTESQINEAIKNLTDNERYIIKTKFGDNLSEEIENGCWCSSYHEEFKNIKKKLYNILLSKYPEREEGKKIEIPETTNTTFQDANADQTLEFSNNPILLKSVLSMMPRLEVMVLEMKYGLKGECFSTSEMAEDLKISEEEIIIMLQQALNRYKEILNSVSRDLSKNNTGIALSRRV